MKRTPSSPWQGRPRLSEPRDRTPAEEEQDRRRALWKAPLRSEPAPVSPRPPLVIVNLGPESAPAASPLALPPAPADEDSADAPATDRGGAR